MTFLRQYLLAVRCFTRVPVTGSLSQWLGFSPEMLHASAAHLPGVGLLAGLVACTVFALTGLALPGTPYDSLVAALASTAATLFLTGASHEAGAAHMADGLAGGAQGDEALELMQDARLGTHGVLTLLVTQLAKLSLLAVLAWQSPLTVLTALLAAHVVSRFWPLLLMRTLPYLGAADGSDGKLLASPIDRRALAIGAGWCVVPLLIALMVQVPAFAITAVLASGLALMAVHRLLWVRLHGFTRDAIGATQQACEIAFYLGAAIGLAIG